MWWLDALTWGQLYAVVLLNGCATVFFDVGSQTALPLLVSREPLVRANAAMVGLQAVGNVAGRGLGGGLVQLLTAPVAIVCAAGANLASALRLTALRPPEPPTGWLLAMARTGVDNVLGVGIRQHLTPDALLGRMNATFRCLLTGAVLAVAFLPVFLSPVRARRALPVPGVSRS